MPAGPAESEAVPTRDLIRSPIGTCGPVTFVLPSADADGLVDVRVRFEKAARGKGGTIYAWGNEADKSRANYGRVSVSTKPVGSYPTGASPYQLLDMAGNVSEWTRSLKRAYPYDPKDGREDPKATGGRGAWRVV